MMGVFDAAVGAISIDYIGNDSSDTGLLQVFSSLDVLLGSYTTASLGTNDFETMTLSGLGDISYFIASGDSGQSSGGLDNLSWTSSMTPVPLPAAGFLMIAALGGFGVFRRRKRATT